MRKPKFNIPLDEFEITPAKKETEKTETKSETPIVEKKPATKKKTSDPKSTGGAADAPVNGTAKTPEPVIRQKYMPEGMSDIRANKVKGKPKPKMLLTFTEEINTYIRYESRRRGLSATQFVNNVLFEYMNSPEGYCNE